MQSTQTRGMIIPKRVRYLSESELPNDLSKTPGGTMYASTPGGTRIIYELDQMMKLRHSPMSKTPPRNLPFIPGVTKATEFNQKPSMLISDFNNNKLASKPLKIVEERSVDADFELEL